MKILLKKSLPYLLFPCLLINCSSNNESLIGGLTEDNIANEFFAFYEYGNQRATVSDENQLAFIENEKNDYSINFGGWEIPLNYDRESDRLLFDEDSFIKFENLSEGSLLEKNANYYEADPKRVDKRFTMLNCSEWAKSHLKGDSAHYVADTYRENWNIRQRIFEFPAASDSGPVNIYYMGDKAGDTSPDPQPAISIYQNNTFEITEDCMFKVKFGSQNDPPQDSINVDIEMIPHGFQFTNPETDSLEIYTLEHIYLADKLKGIWTYGNSEDMLLIGFTEIHNGIGVIIKLSETGEILDFGTILLNVDNSIRGKLQITWVISETGTTWDTRMNSKRKFTMTPPGNSSFFVKK